MVILWKDELFFNKLNKNEVDMNAQGSFSFGNNNGRGPFSSIVGILVAIGVFIALFWFLQILFEILWYLTPVMLVATAIIDHKVILGYFGWLGRLFRRNPLYGILAGGLSIVGAPVVALVLLGRAFLGKKVREIQQDMEQKQQGEFVEYEEVSSETLELPQLEERPRPEPEPEKRQQKNDYEDLF